MTVKRWQKEEKAWDEILTKFFNSQNPNGIKSELSQLQGRWRQLNKTPVEKEA